MATTKYKKGKDGYFQAKVWDGTYVNDEKHRITLRTKKSSRELENMVNEHNRKIADREYIRVIDITFLDYARKWKEVYKANKSKNTQAMYYNVIEKHLYVVKCQMNAINRMDYQMLLNSIPGDRTRQQVSMTFKQIVKSAIKDKLLPANVYNEIFDDTETIHYRAPEKRALTETEKKATFDADLDPPDKVFLYILYGCGLRRGEALALSRFNISIDRRELTVGGSVAFDGNNPYLKGTKTRNGERTVPIPEMILPALESYLATLKGTLLFPSRNNDYLSKSSYDKKWARIIKGMEKASGETFDTLTAHIYRHNYCANLCYKIPEISINMIAQLLGDNERMVIDVYNHCIAHKEKPHDVVADALAL